MFRFILLSAPALIIFLWLIGTFEDNDKDKNTGAVRYSGETLYVNGKSYPREPASGDYLGVGAISVLPQPEKSPDVHALLRQLGLTILEQAGTDGTGLIVEVPMGFEQQWALAISTFAEVAWTGAADYIPPQDAIPKSTTASIEQQAPSKSIPPPGEPTEADLRRLQFQIYNNINEAGGMPVTATATGTTLTLRPTLYSVRKESCRSSPQRPEGTYQCNLTILLSLAADGSDPSEQGARISVKWDGLSGEWVLDN